MPRYAKMLSEGMINRGHEVAMWTPKARFFNLPSPRAFKKWLGYLDQYLVFPFEIKQRLRNCSADTLFVFADQALGPWVPLVKNRLHVVHCHDFLALNSALGNIAENSTAFSGRIYQSYIQRGFSKGRNFISVSQKTQQDLKQFHQSNIQLSEVCYNGLNRPFKQLNTQQARIIIGDEVKVNLKNGYILHIGGNQYYKNRKGVIEIYNAWRATNNGNLPLLMIGSAPTKELKSLYENSTYRSDIYFRTGVSDEYINEAYSGATCLLYPSIAEGFGWPIAEAMASGCLVITTDLSPMTEVAGNAGFFLLSKRPFDELLVNDWAINSAKQIDKVVNLSTAERLNCLDSGFKNVKRFDEKSTLDKIEIIYQKVLRNVIKLKN